MMKRNLTASDRVSAAISAMLIMDHSNWESQGGLKSAAYGLALMLKDDPKKYRELIQRCFANLLALEDQMDAYILNIFYDVQTSLGISPVSELATTAHRLDGKDHKDTEWCGFVEERNKAIRALKESLKVAA